MQRRDCSSQEDHIRYVFCHSILGIYFIMVKIIPVNAEKRRRLGHRVRALAEIDCEFILVQKVFKTCWIYSATLKYYWRFGTMRVKLIKERNIDSWACSKRATCSGTSWKYAAGFLITCSGRSRKIITSIFVLSGTGSKAKRQWSWKNRWKVHWD